jgi:hypothetical protein
MFRNAWIVAIAGLALTGCGDHEFGEGQIRVSVEGQQIQLDGEQVTLTRPQVDCGAQNDLWRIDDLGDHQIGRLTQKARDLNFGDDVQIDETHPNPYAQLRGSFHVMLIKVDGIQDDGPDGKLVDAKLGVKIDHPCFEKPLPVLMGVRKGQFTETASAKLRFRMDDNWVYDQIVH